MPVELPCLTPEEIQEYYQQYCYCIVPWGLVVGEAKILEYQGKITNLEFRLDKFSGEYVVRFKPTEKLERVDLFNFDDYGPDKYENRRKWHKLKF